MARRGGFLSRILNRVREAFSAPQEPPRPPVRGTGRGAPPRADRDRQRARERDPYLGSWDAVTRGTRPGSYQDHRDFVTNMNFSYDVPVDEQKEFWDDYVRYMVGRKGVRQPYRRDDVRNPFWQKWGISPAGFDWQAWREAMGY